VAVRSDNYFHHLAGSGARRRRSSLPTRAGRTAVVPLVCLLAAGLSGCDNDKKITAPPVVSDYLPQSSMSNVLANLKTAYEKRNLQEYLKLFSPDYVFIFNPADANDPDSPTPTQWGLAEEQTSTSNMFTDTRVESIQLDLVQEAATRADSALYGAGIWRVKVLGANLRVNTRTETGEPLTYLVPGTLEVFYFRLDPHRLATDGQPTWCIVRWEDQPFLRAWKTEGKSWGEIKSIYH
jgi:hypothetical protein